MNEMILITKTINLYIFPDYIKKVADELALSYWDWSAIILSLTSLFIAVLSFIVAKRTLKSQRRTEINTSPIINKKVQLFLLNNSLRELYESLISITALYAALEHTDYRIYPSRQFWNLVYIDTSNFHEELFYEDSFKFQAIYYLKTCVEKFNSDVSDLENCISKSDVSSDLKRTIIMHICEDIGTLVQLWGNCYETSLGSTKYELLSFLEENFFECKFCRFNHIWNDNNELIRYFIPNTPFGRQVEEIVQLFVARFDPLKVLFNLDFKESRFKSNTSHYVDLLLLNVLYNSEAFASYIMNCENKSKINCENKSKINCENKSKIIFETSDHHMSNPWFKSPYTPEPNSYYSWIFYFNDIQEEK